MTSNRAAASIKNSSFSIITQVLTVVINFVVKTIFIYTLGSEYLGINGLFSNIITMLSLADLGIGIAIPYSLYKPLSTEDHEKIKSLMYFYKRIYNIIGIAVLMIGFSITPFLSFLIKEMPENIPHIYLIYIMFVTHSASSYFFVYKKFLIDADQKGYITSKITFLFSTVLSIVQIILLLTTHNFILYLGSSIVMVILQNIYISKKAEQLYPYLKEKKVQEIDKQEYKEIKKNVSSLFIYKIGSVIMNGTDNIVISKIIGLVMVGIYSNYLMIINSIYNILNQIFNAITSSIGNLVVTTNEKRSRNVYENLNFFTFLLYGTVSICIMIFINPFIRIWIGEEYVLSNWVAFLISFNLYITGMQSVTTSFRNAYGLFYKAKYRPIFMCILNIIISVILAYYFGISGVILGTIISRLITVVWLDPYIIYEYGFKENVKDFYKQYSIYLLLYLILGGITMLCYHYLSISNLVVFILYGIVTFSLLVSIICLLFHKTKEFRYFYDYMIPKINKFLKKKRVS